MKYCKKCVMPDTRAGIVLDDHGICNACRWSEQKTVIDWNARRSRLQDIANQAKAKAQGSWDCVVGVSGGKDSTWQALFLRNELGLNPLLAQYAGSDTTELGLRNIENLCELGFDLITLKPNPRIAKLLSKKSFYQFGNLVKYSDTALFPTPFRIAMAHKIPVVFFGENPALEAGDLNTQGDGWDATKIINNNTLGGHGADIWLGDGVASKDLLPYIYPSEEELNAWGGRGFFMGYFISWSGYRNGSFAVDHGMEGIKADPKDIGIHLFHNCLDSNNGGIVNSMLKHIKLGFGNTTEFVSYDIREGRVTREEAIKLVKELDGNCHPRYIEDYCRWIGITVEEFWKVANSFRGDMWERGTLNGWQIKDPIWEQESFDDTINIYDIINRIDTRISR